MLDTDPPLSVVIFKGIQIFLLALRKVVTEQSDGVVCLCTVTSKGANWISFSTLKLVIWVTFHVIGTVPIMCRNNLLAYFERAEANNYTTINGGLTFRSPRYHSLRKTGRCLLACLLTHSMVQDIILKADCHSDCQTISCFLYGTRSFIMYSQKPATGPYPEPAESSSPHPSLSP
jgi:hypothetical protein